MPIITCLVVVDKVQLGWSKSTFFYQSIWHFY